LLDGGVRYRRFGIRRPLGEAEIESINKTDCALLCGTNLYQHDWESDLTAAALSRIRVPVIPFGVGGSAAGLSDTDVSEQTRRMIRALHEHCRMGGVRDPHAAEVASRAGVRNFVMTGCPVLYWAGAGGLPAVRPVRRERIILTARNWLMHRWPDNVDHPVQIEFLRAVLDHFGRERILFAVHEDFDRRLIEVLGIPPDQAVDSEDPDDYIRLYTHPEHVVLAMRLHAGMLAVANGVPAVFIGHDTRTYAFCGMMGIEHLELFDARCTAETIARIERILEGDVSAFGRAAEAFERLRPAMRAFLEANSLPARAEI
jgi:polysaccharide pyruvyl transferase WcaK-like protein